MALFALALQAAVSFGHVHRDDLGLPPLAGDERTQIAAATPGSQAPAGHHHQPASDDYCPICASVALLTSSIPALAPALVTPTPVVRIWLPAVPADALSPQIPLSFQARAPPVA